MKKHVFITRKIHPIAKDILSKKFEVHENEKFGELTDNDLKNIVFKYDAILSTVREKFTKEILKNKKNLKLISNYAVGLNNIDTDFANSIGIKVYNTPDVVTDSTADLTIALLLSLIRKIPEASNFVKRNEWKSWDPNLFVGKELQGKTLGIIGFGRIGQAVAKRAIGFGLKVIFCNPSKIKKSISDKSKQVKLDYLLKESDIISLHAPLNEATKNLIDYNAFKKMLKKPIILNLARGEILNTEDLTRALKEELIWGVALDVTNPEPIPKDHKLLSLKNCIIVPHIGTATIECRHNMAKMAAENIVNNLK